MEQTNTEKRLPWYGIPAILPYLKEYRTKMVIMVFFGAVSSVADAVFPLFNRYALNHFADGKTLDTMGLFVLLYVAVLLVQVAANLISAFLISFVELDVGRDLKNAAFNHLQTLSFSYYNNHSVGYLHARVMSDTDRIGTLVTWRLMDLVWYFSYIISVFFVMFRINAELSAMLLLLLPIAILLTGFFQRRLVVLNRKIRS